MESPTPMDRLLCGDVGYGKTEVAMRAAFKAVMDGKQVAFPRADHRPRVPAPEDADRSLCRVPVRIDMVSRFRSKAEQRRRSDDLAPPRSRSSSARIGCSRRTCQFRGSSACSIVDEEQRFGVAHKERIKQLRKRVGRAHDVGDADSRDRSTCRSPGIRDMSIIETPPKDPLSIQTNVVKFDQEVMRRAIGNELERGGQVFFVHNRVESIYSMGNLLHRLVPAARSPSATGQMGGTSSRR
jgi:transcription-repair coupling factor (superfamily II helicase)